MDAFQEELFLVYKQRETLSCLSSGRFAPTDVAYELNNTELLNLIGHT